MIIFKVENISNGKVYIGHAVNDNPNNLGTGKYIKRAVKDFGTKSFTREVLERFSGDEPLGIIMDRVEYWIKKYKADNPRYGYNETIVDLIPKKKRLTNKIQVLLTPDDEERINEIIIENSMNLGIKPVPISKYIRQLILEHIVEQTSTSKMITNLKNKIKK